MLFEGRTETKRSSLLLRGDCLPLRGTRRREERPPRNDKLRFCLFCFRHLHGYNCIGQTNAQRNRAEPVNGKR
jgi:hypothetical protein